MKDIRSEDSDTSVLSRPPAVEVADRLTADGLQDLAEGRLLALRVPRYTPAEASGEIARRLVEHPRYGTYSNAPDIGRVGMAFFETIHDPELKETYFSEAAAAMVDLRKACLPQVSPVDRVRGDLNSLWPSGAGLLVMDRRPMFVGLARVFRGKAEAIPHQDVLRRDAEDFPLAYRLTAQIAANVYLRPSEEGGELELWDRSYTDEEYDARRWKGSYGLDRDRIPGSDALLRPETGDLILFNANKVHAVRPTMKGTRVTLSMFIGARGTDEPLVYWS